MLGKLMKYEFRATGRIMLPGLGALIVLAGVASLSITNSLENSSTLLQILRLTMFLLLTLGVAVAAVLVVAVQVLRFYRSLMRDEGYLTLSLPVSVHSLVWSKLLVSLTWAVVTAAMMVALLFLTLRFSGQNETLELFRTMIWPEMDLSEVWGEMACLVALAAVDLLLSVCASFLRFFAAISLGHCFNKGKLLLSVVFFLGFGLVMDFIDSAAGEFLCDLVLNANIPSDLMQECGIMAVSILLQLVRGVILYFATVLPLQKRVNLS